MNEIPDVRAMRIFLVENHPDTARWLALYLEDLGHTIISVETLSDAVQKFPSADCDILLTDIGLPDGSGWDLLAQVRPSRPVFAVAMSGAGVNADYERSRAAGYRHHLLKPFRISELDELLAQAAAELSANVPAKDAK